MLETSRKWGMLALALATGAALAAPVALRPMQAYAEDGIEVVQEGEQGQVERGHGSFDDTPVVSYVAADGTQGSQECSTLDDHTVMPIKGGWWLLDYQSVAKDKVIEVTGDAHFVVSGPVDLGSGHVHVTDGAHLSIYAEADRKDATSLTNSNWAAIKLDNGSTVSDCPFEASIATADEIKYQDENGKTQYKNRAEFECDLATFDGKDVTLNNAWYYVSKNTSISGRIEVAGGAKIVLCNGATLTCCKGIHVPSGKSIEIYSSPDKRGILCSCPPDGYDDLNYKAVIGGNKEESCGMVGIYGTQVIAESWYGAAIGGGAGGNGGKVVIRHSIVSAVSNVSSAGIGGGHGCGVLSTVDAGSGGIVVITDSVVYAQGGKRAAGIGGGGEPGNCAGGDGGDVTIEGNSVVKAISYPKSQTGGARGAAIGRGEDAEGVGAVHLSDNLKVTDLSANVGMVATFGEREGYCLYRNYVKVEPGESRK